MMKGKEWLMAIGMLLTLYLPLFFFFGKELLAGQLTPTAFSDVFFISGKYLIYLKSIGTALLAALISTGLGFALAFAVIKSDLARSECFAFLFILPLTVPSFVYLEAVLFFSEWTGWNLYNPAMYVTVLAVIYMPFSAIIFGSGFRSVPARLEESASQLAPGKLWFTHVTLMWLRPFFLSAFFITFLFVFTNYEIASLMNVHTYNFLIFNQLSAFFSYSNTVLLTLPVCGLFLIMIFLESAIMGNRAFFNLSLTNSSSRMRLSSKWRIALWTFLAFLATLVTAPFVVLVIRATTIRSFSTLFGLYWHEVAYSCLLAGGAGVLTVGIAAFVARALVLAPPAKRRILSFLSLAPFAIPPALIAVGLISLSSQLGGDGTTWATLLLIWGLSARFFPIIVQVLYAGARTVDVRLIEAGQMFCRSWFRDFLQLWLPLNRRAITRGFLFFFVLSFSEISLAVLLVPPDKMTAPVNIYSMLHYGFGKEVAAETLMVLAVVLTLGALILKKAKQKWETPT